MALDLLTTVQKINEASEHTNLGQAVFDGIQSEEIFNINGEDITRRDYIRQKGYGSIADLNETELQNHIEETFAKFYKYHENGEYFKDTDSQSAEAKTSFEDLCLLLIISDTAKGILADDWEVNRLRGVEQNLGLKHDGVAIAQNVWAKKYGNNYQGQDLLAVDKGGGNGAFTHMLKKKQHNGKINNLYKHTSIGDKPRFPIEPYILPYIKSEFKDNPIVKEFLAVILSVLKERLQKRWFKASTVTIGDWEQKMPFCDMNEIFDELRSIMSKDGIYFGDFFNSRTGEVIYSGKFPKDSKRTVSLELQELLMKAQGKEQTSISQMLTERSFKYYKEKLAEEGKNYETLISYKKRISQINALDTNNNIDGEWSNHKGDFIKWLKIESNTPVNTNIDFEDCKKLAIDLIHKGIYKITGIELKEDTTHYTLAEELKQLCSVKNSELTNLRTKKNEAKIEGYTFETGTKVSPGTSGGDILSSLFAESFLGNIKPEEGSKTLDLNKIPNLYPAEFSKAWFTDMDQVYPEKNIASIISSRADSHEPGQMFGDDIEKNMELLAPGGYIMTDGVRESFTDINRLHELQEKFEGSNEYKIDVVVDHDSQRVTSVFIQRNHPKIGYFTEDEKRRFYAVNTDFLSLEEVLERPYIYLTNLVRRRFEALMISPETGDRSVDDFVNVQSLFRQTVDDVIIREALLQKSYMGNPWFQQIEENYNRSKEITDKYSSTNLPLKDIISGSLNGGLFQKSVFIETVNSGLPEKEKIDLAMILESYPIVLDLLLGDKKDVTQIDILHMINPDFSMKSLQGDIRHGNIKFSKKIMDDISFKIESALAHTIHWMKTEHRIVRGGSLDPIRPDEVRLFWPTTERAKNSGHATGVGQKNPVQLMHTDNLPKNEYFGTAEAQNRLTKGCRKFAKGIERLQKKLIKKSGINNFKPITLLSYPSCVTNDLLVEKLNLLFGKKFVDSYVEVLDVSFPQDEDKGITNQKVQKNTQRIAQNIRYGGLVIGGGGWGDSHDEEGNSFKRHYGGPILDALIKGDSELRMLGICHTYQTFADMIGKKFYQGKVQNRPGPLAVGLMPFRHNNHRIFQHMPEGILAASTHSGHIVPSGVNLKDSPHLQIIAHSEMTGLPTAYEALEGKMIGLQSHPELDFTNPVHAQRVKAQLSISEAEFHQRYGVGVGRIFKNISALLDEEIPESGDHILNNTLNYLLDSIKKT